MLAFVQRLERPRGDEAGEDRRHRAGVECSQPIRGAGFLEIGRERGDDEHRLQAFAQKDHGRLNEHT